MSNYAVVTTERSSLKVYSTTNATDSTYLGILITNTIVEVLEYRVVNNVEWAKIKADDLYGWAIKKYPSVSYPFLDELPEAAIKNIEASKLYNMPLNTRKNNNSDVGSLINTSNTGTVIETAGEVPNVTDQTMYKSSVVTHPTLDAVKNFSFEGYSLPIYGSEFSNLPQNVQNHKGYPTIDRYDKNSNRYEYNYETDYSNNEVIKALQSVRESVNIIEESSTQLYDRYAKFYNRFKVATHDDVLSKTFAHVFFTRPDCNIIYNAGDRTFALQDQVSGFSDYVLEFKNNSNTLIQLSQDVGLDHQFMMLPSNRVNSFECRDRNIKSDTYGKTFHGHSIAYGRHINDSLAASEVSISFNDDNKLHLFRMHQMWVEYISDVNMGNLRPKQIHIANKCLDYACSVYYIVCGENGEDIIYWSKLYGLFPTSIPDSIMTWNKSQIITNPEISITYQYSFKRDWKADIIQEFNLNSSGTLQYLQTYNPEILSTGNTWVGAPFIELVKDSSGRTVYKLRFRKN